MNKTIIEIILIILLCLLLITNIIIGIWGEHKPQKYYKIEYYYDYKYVSSSIIKARTPKQAIDKLIRKYQRDFHLNEITDVISCTGFDYYKCLKEVSKDE